MSGSFLDSRASSLMRIVIADSLWRRVVEWLRSVGLIEVWPEGRDRARVREVLFEVYLLGERPNVAEVREAIRQKNPDWAREVAQLWTLRLRKPHQVPKLGGWRYPFYVPAEILGRSAVADRLVVQVEHSAAAYARLIAEGATARELVEADASLRLQTDALRVWGQTHVTWKNYDGDDVWGRIPSRARPLVGPHPRIVYEESVNRLR
jgi:hypothetical protein